MKVLLMLLEVQNGIPYQLAGPVEGDIATALDVENRNATPLQLRWWKRKTMRPGSPPQGNDRLVLDQEQKVFGGLTGNAAPAETPLQLQDLAVRSAAQVLHQ
jgi:hypothetical protein